jgi:hypothetical protein
MPRWTSLKLGTPWAVSLVIHVALVGALALLAYRVAFEPEEVPQRSVEFDDAGAERVAAPAASRSPVEEGSGDVSPTGAVLPEATPATDVAVPAVPVAPLGGTPEQREAWLAPGRLTGAGRPGGDAPEAGMETSRPTGGDVKFAGLGSSNARSVVYVVDASGPMVSSLREVVEEIDRSISRLSASQKFGVVAFGSGAKAGTSGGVSGYSSFMPVLVRATPQAKEEVRRWLGDLAPSGRSNPLAGLRGALKLKPDAVFLLSRGIERSGGGVWELGLDATMAELDGLNPASARTGRRPVVIKTIQFLDEDPTGTMQRIGQLHGSTVSRTGARQPGYRVIRRGAELAEDAPLEPEP